MLTTTDNDPVVEASRHQELSRDYMPRLYANDDALTELFLTDTSCSDVALSALTDALRVNTHVTHLELACNGITDVGARFVSEMLMVNSTLTFVMLDGNAIGTDGLWRLAHAMEVNFELKTLSVTDNAVADVDPEAVLALETMIRLNSHPLHLKKLVLSAERGDNIEEIDLALPQPSHRTEHDPQVHLDDYCALVLARMMADNGTVVTLNLSNHHISDEGAAHLSAMLGRNRCLDRLILTGNLISDVGAAGFVRQIEENNSIRTVQLMDTFVSAEMLVEMEFAFSLNRQPLRLKKYYGALLANDKEVFHLEFDDHLSQRYYDDVSVRLLTIALKDNTHLMSLVVTCGKVGPVGARFMGEFLKGNRTLKQLDLSHNPLEGGSASIAVALQENKTLQALSLCDTDMTDDAAAHFATMLEGNSTLGHLDLSDNAAIAVSGALFAYAFNVNKHLTHFTLDGTGVSERVKQTIEDRRTLGLEPRALQDVLPQIYEAPETLTRVSLRGDEMVGKRQLTNTSMRLLSVPLKNNYHITALDISRNNISYDGMASVLRSIYENRVSLQTLDVSHNPVDHPVQFAKIVAGLVQSHAALTSINLAHTGLDTAACEVIIAELDVAKLNVLKHADISGNDIDRRIREKFALFLRCNSLAVVAFKGRLRALYRAWWSNELRALPTPVLEFNNYPLEEDFKAHTTKDFDGVVPVLCSFLRIAAYEEICFAGNGISDAGAAELADFLAGAKTCKAIDLSQNHIGSAGIDTLTHSIKQNYAIRQIDVTGNEEAGEEALAALVAMLKYNEQPADLKDILVGLTSNTLVTLDQSFRSHDHLHDGHIELFCKALGGNTSLTSINLSNNYITAAGMTMLIDHFTRHTALQKFYLRNTLAVGGAELGAKTAELLRSPCPLQHLDFSYNEFENAWVPPMLDAVGDTHTLVSLTIIECGVAPHLERALTTRVSLNTETDLKHVVSNLASNDLDIVDFDISRSNYSDPNVIEIFAALATNTVVTKVNISHNMLTDDCGVSMMSSIIDNRYLTTLNLSNNNFKDPLVMSLCRLLRVNTTLTSIDISNNNFTSGAIQPLRHLLHDNHTIVELIATSSDCDEDLSFLQLFEMNRQLTVKHVLASVAANSPSVRSVIVGLSDCATDLGVELLEEALRHNTHVTHIDMAHGRITDAGAARMERMLVRSQSLTRLGLCGNALTDVGAQAFADALKVNGSLRFLDLTRNNITAAGVMLLRRACELNTTLQRLKVEDADIENSADAPGRESLTTDLAQVVFLNNRTPHLKAFVQAEDFGRVTELDFSNLRTAPLFDEGSSDLLPPPCFDDDACAVLCDTLRANTNVTYVNLAKNGLGHYSALAIAHVLRENSTIRVLNLADNMMADSGMMIIDACSANDTVTGVDLSGNDVNYLSINRLNVLLALNREPLIMKRVMIDLIENMSEPRTFQINLPPVLDNAADEAATREQDAVDGEEDDYAFETDVDAEAWRKLLRNARQRRHLRKWQLDDGSVALICDVLQRNMSIRELDLSWNAIGNRGVIRIADLFAHATSSIVIIRLAHNNVSDEGVELLAGLMGKSSTMEIVDVSHNMATDDSCLPVIEAMTRNAVSRVFDLRGCRVSGESVAAVEEVALINDVSFGSVRASLIGAFLGDPTVTSFDFNSLVSLGMWGDRTLDLLRAIAPRAVNVTELHLEYNDLTDADVPKLCDVLTAWPCLTELSVACNFIVDARPLCAALMDDRCGVTKVDLRKNKLNLVSGRAIADMLREDDQLTALNVEENCWGRIGGALILSALSMNDGLKSIYLNGEGISDDVTAKADNALTLHYKHLALKQDDGALSESESWETSIDVEAAPTSFVAFGEAPEAPVARRRKKKSKHQTAPDEPFGAFNESPAEASVEPPAAAAGGAWEYAKSKR
jgi:Ran GTPase-activating protein (RanGAP) involved in mRNA processing and transport